MRRSTWMLRRPSRRIAAANRCPMATRWVTLGLSGRFTPIISATNRSSIGTRYGRLRCSTLVALASPMPGWMQAAMAWESKASPLAVTQSFSSACTMSSLKGTLRSQAWSSSRRGFHAACLLRARIVVFIAMTSAATMRLRSPDPASESYPPGFELGSPVKKARASVRPLSTRLSPSSRFTAAMRSGSAIPVTKYRYTKTLCPSSRALAACDPAAPALACLMNPISHTSLPEAVSRRSSAASVRFSLRGIAGVTVRVLRLGDGVAAAGVAAGQRKALRLVMPVRAVGGDHLGHRVPDIAVPLKLGRDCVVQRAGIVGHRCRPGQGHTVARRAVAALRVAGVAVGPVLDGRVPAAPDLEDDLVGLLRHGHRVVTRAVPGLVK